MHSPKLTLSPRSSSGSVSSLKEHLNRSSPNLSMSPRLSSLRKYHITDKVSDKLQTFHGKVSMQIKFYLVTIYDYFRNEIYIIYIYICILDLNI